MPADPNVQTSSASPGPRVLALCAVIMLAGYAALLGRGAEAANEAVVRIVPAETAAP